MKPTVIVYWSDESPDPDKLLQAVINVHASEKRKDRIRSFYVTHDPLAADEMLKETAQNDKRSARTRKPLRR